MTAVTEQPLARLVVPGVALVRSRDYASNGIEYEVRLGLDGGLLCNCPASFNYLRCHHLEKARKVIMTTQAVAIRPIVPVPTMALVPSRQDLDLVKEAAKMIFAGRVALPEELNSEAKVAAIMLYGLELGLRPMTAIRNLYIVKGRVEPSAKLMAGMLMRSDPKAKLVVEKIEVGFDNSGKPISGFCTMRLIRPSRDIDQRWSVDWDQIKRAGLARDNNLLYPEDRLKYHCTKRLMRTYAPDIIEGLAEDGPTLESLGVETDAPANEGSDGLYNEGDEPAEGEYRDINRETGEIREPAPTSSPAPESKANAAAPQSADVTCAPPEGSGEGEPALATAEQIVVLKALFRDIRETWPSADSKALAAELKPVYGEEGLKDVSKLTQDLAANLLRLLRELIGAPPEGGTSGGKNSIG